MPLTATLSSPSKPNLIRNVKIKNDDDEDDEDDDSGPEFKKPRTSGSSSLLQPASPVDELPSPDQQSTTSPTPSTASSVSLLDPSTRMLQLAYASDLTRESGIALRYAHTVLTYAQHLLHRYYACTHKNSLTDHATIWICGGALLLAGKVHNTPQTTRNISSVLHHRLGRRELPNLKVDVLDYFREEGYDWKTEINRGEKRILYAIGFKLRPEVLRHHHFVIVFANALRSNARAPDWSFLELPSSSPSSSISGSGAAAPGTSTLSTSLPSPASSSSSSTAFLSSQSQSLPSLIDPVSNLSLSQLVKPFHTLLQHAWNFANDFLLIDTCVLEPPEAIACACIQLSIQHMNNKGTDTQESTAFRLPPGWQAVFGSSAEDTQRIANEFSRISNLPPLRGNFIDYSLSERFCTFHPSKKRRLQQPVNNDKRKLLKSSS